MTIFYANPCKYTSYDVIHAYQTHLIEMGTLIDIKTKTSTIIGSQKLTS